jgi:hypothetical protein
MSDTNPLPMNVYQMWMTSRDNAEGVWLTRTTWPGVCVRVTSVGEIKGPSPFFGNPKVLGDLYDMDGTLKQSGVSLPMPGTSKTWRQIPAPAWWKAANA